MAVAIAIAIPQIANATSAKYLIVLRANYRPFFYAHGRGIIIYMSNVIRK